MAREQLHKHIYFTHRQHVFTVTIMHKKQVKQKRYKQKNYHELNQHTATLRQYYFNRDRRHPQSFTQNPKENKRSCDFPQRVVQPCALDLDSEPPSGVVTRLAGCSSWLVRVSRGPSPNVNTTSPRPRGCVANIHLRRTENWEMNSGGTPTATRTGR